MGVDHERSPILRLAAQSWAVSDRLDPADAVIVLGGGEDRAYAAAELYRSGLASRILVDDDADQRLVSNLDIPPQAVQMFGSGLRNTYQESCALAEWVAKNGAQRIIVPTELFPSRRVRWIFTRELRNLGATVMIDVVQIPEYTADNWWSGSAGRNQFLTEIVKYFYYRVRYSLVRC